MIKKAIIQAARRENLDFELTKAAMEEIADGKATDAQIAAFLTAMRMKGETAEEITAAASVMKEKCFKVSLHNIDAIDIVGTGGDCADTFNISTTSMFVVASGGVSVAKHGSRSASGKTGAADVLEALGVNILTTPSQEREIFDRTGLCFMYAQNHHPAMRYVASVRREIKIRTFFNILGPLVNPANASMQIMGVFEPELVDIMAYAMVHLGVKNGMVIHGLDGLDEATVTDETMVCEIRNGNMMSYKINPSLLGFGTYSLGELKSADIEENVQIMKDIFSGKEQGAKKDIVVLNSALAFYTAKKVDSLLNGVALAKELIESGAAEKKFYEFIKITNEVR